MGLLKQTFLNEVDGPRVRRGGVRGTKVSCRSSVEFESYPDGELFWPPLWRDLKMILGLQKKGGAQGCQKNELTLLSHSHFSQHSWTTMTSTPGLGLWSSRQTDVVGTHFLTFQWASARKSPEIVEIWLAGGETEEGLDNSEVRKLVPN